jgi:hypothetical protein
MKILGLIVLAVGWIVTYYLSRLKDQKLESQKIKLQHLNSQISQFYGPIYSILLENDRIRQLIHKQFGRDAIFENGKELTKVEFETWSHYLENYLIPNNRKIINILKDKIHLVQGDSFPSIFREWIDYALGYELYHKQFKDIGREYSFRSISNFPLEFRAEIINIMSQLRKKQFEIVNVKLPSPYQEKDKTEQQY